MDVSEWQGSINWEQVKSSGIEFAYIRLINYLSNYIIITICIHNRASSGISYIDKQWHNNKNGARKAGVKAGAYHYFYPADNPVTQA